MSENQMKNRITDFRLTVLRIFSLFPLTVPVAEPCPMCGKTEFWVVHTKQCRSIISSS
ncbi:MAG: hypothetical protein LWX02_05005 [Deltaproteobacteria bacterium]|jgi:hypothetical protein|nr:hypothetical protein [Deltaproteobacteria bacterium]MDL1988261.1 hypothetical protein [Deltaproteobacteria bacterium]